MSTFDHLTAAVAIACIAHIAGSAIAAVVCGIYVWIRLASAQMTEHNRPPGTEDRRNRTAETEVITMHGQCADYTARQGPASQPEHPPVYDPQQAGIIPIIWPCPECRDPQKASAQHYATTHFGQDEKGDRQKQGTARCEVCGVEFGGLSFLHQHEASVHSYLIVCWKHETFFADGREARWHYWHVHGTRKLSKMRTRVPPPARLRDHETPARVGANHSHEAPIPDAPREDDLWLHSYLGGWGGLADEHSFVDWTHHEDQMDSVSIL
ncbi:hypothetical protein P7C73_g4586, partial [Tremellales sp. Uapishka_1]